MIKQIYSLVELLAALSNPQPATLELQTSILCPYSITLPVGFNMRGVDKEKCILSFSNSDGIGLTANNEVSNLNIQTRQSGNIFIKQLSRFGNADIKKPYHHRSSSNFNQSRNKQNKSYCREH